MTAALATEAKTPHGSMSWKFWISSTSKTPTTGNNISPSNIIDSSSVVGSVFKYENLSRENIHISFGHTRRGYELYGAESVRVTFSIRY